MLHIEIDNKDEDKPNLVPNGQIGHSNRVMSYETDMVETLIKYEKDKERHTGSAALEGGLSKLMQWRY